MTRKRFRIYNPTYAKDVCYIGYSVEIMRFKIREHFDYIYFVKGVRRKSILFYDYRFFDTISSFRSLEDAYAFIDSLSDQEV